MRRAFRGIMKFCWVLLKNSVACVLIGLAGAVVLWPFAALVGKQGDYKILIAFRIFAVVLVCLHALLHALWGFLRVSIPGYYAFTKRVSYYDMFDACWKHNIIKEKKFSEMSGDEVSNWLNVRRGIRDVASATVRTAYDL